jgi:hypothetical protein
MSKSATLGNSLAALSLTAIDPRLETLLESASKKKPSYGDFLLEVMSAVSECAKAAYLKTRLQLAHLPYLKTLDQFDFGFQPSIDERQIRELRTLPFVHEASNVILLGPPGVGKSGRIPTIDRRNPALLPRAQMGEPIPANSSRCRTPGVHYACFEESSGEIRNQCLAPVMQGALPQGRQ